MGSDSAIRPEPAAERTEPPGRVDRRLAGLVFLVGWLSFVYFFHGGGWGVNAFLDVTRAIVEKGTFSIDGYVSNTGDWAQVGQSFFINKNPGASFLAVPAYFLIHLAAPDAYSTFEGAQAATHVAIAFSFALLAAVAMGLFFLWLRRSHPPAASLAATAVAAFGTSYFSYASAFSAGVVVAACYVVAGYAITRAREELSRGTAESARPSRERTGRQFASLGFAALAGFALGWAILTEPVAAPAALIFAVYALWTGAGRRSLAGIALGAIPPVALLAFYNYRVTGSVLTTVYQHQNPIFNFPGAALGVLRAPSLDVLYWITFHPIRGLFWISPVLLLSVPGLVFMWRQKSSRPAAFLCSGIVAVYLLFNISFSAWSGGWSIGPRYLAPAMPLLAFPLAWIFARKTFRVPAAILAAVSIIIQLMIVSINPSPPQLGGMTNPLVQYILPVFRQGVVSVNNQSILQKGAADIFSLGNFQEVWASYNLGELAGWRGPLSLLPLLFLWAAVAMIAFRLVRARTHPGKATGAKKEIRLSGRARFNLVMISALAIGLWTRFSGLTLFPIFNDEAIYLPWAKAVSSDLGNLLISFSANGQKPLFSWLSALAMKCVSEPLAASRLVSAVFGLLTIAGVGFAARLLSGRTAGMAGLLIAALSPFLVLYDRLALMDGPAACGIIWAFALAIMLARRPSWKTAAGYGIVQGLSMINKEYAYVGLAFPVLTFFASRWSRPAAGGQDNPSPKGLLIGWLMAYGIAAAIFFSVMIPARVRYGAPLFFGVLHLERSAPEAGALGPSARFFINLPALWEMLVLQIGLGAVLCSVIAAASFARRRVWLPVVLVAAAVALTILQSAILKDFYPRYFVYLAPLYLAAAAAGIGEILSAIRKKKAWMKIGAFGVIAVLFAPGAINALRFGADPAAVRLPAVERKQYFEGWPSGYGLKEVFAFLQQKAAAGPVDVFVTPHWGVPTEAFSLYRNDSKNLRIHLAPWFQEEAILAFASEGREVMAPADVHGASFEILRPADLGQCLFVANIPMISLRRLVELNPGITPVRTVFKPGGKSFWIVLELPRL